VAIVQSLAPGNERMPRSLRGGVPPPPPPPPLLPRPPPLPPLPPVLRALRALAIVTSRRCVAAGQRNSSALTSFGLAPRALERCYVTTGARNPSFWTTPTFDIRDIKLFRFPRCTLLAPAPDVRFATLSRCHVVTPSHALRRRAALGHFGRAAHPAPTTLHALAPRHAIPRVSRQHGCTPWHPCNRWQSCNPGTVQSVALCNQWHHAINGIVQSMAIIGKHVHPFGVCVIEPRSRC
jgi:hypothetical protein